MSHFEKIQKQLEWFTPYLDETVSVSTPCFTQETQKVSDFVLEIEKTGLKLTNTNDLDVAQHLSDIFLKQYGALKQAVSAAIARKKSKSNVREKFHSHYDFPENIYALPEEAQLVECKKAILAFNEKIRWLAEKAENATDETYWRECQNEILRTEKRKQNCQNRIDELEQSCKKS